MGVVTVSVLMVRSSPFNHGRACRSGLPSPLPSPALCQVTASLEAVAVELGQLTRGRLLCEIEANLRG